MLNNPTPSIPANKVSDYKLSNYQVYIAKYSSSPINYPLKPVELWNVGLSSIHFIWHISAGRDDMFWILKFYLSVNQREKFKA